MKKNNSLSLVMLFAVFAGCATVEPTFDPVAVFKNAEESMRKSDFEKARTSYQEIQEKSPDKSYDAVLMLRIADTYFGEGRYSEAMVEYQSFLNYHPVNRDAPYAQYQIAMCSYNELSDIDRDPAPAQTVIRELRKLIERYPKSAYEEQAKKYIALCTDRMSQYELYVARFYHKKASYKAAISRCEQLLKDYPGSSAEKDALYYAGLSYAQIGERKRARAKFELLAQKYPDMKATAESLLKTL